MTHRDRNPGSITRAQGRRLDENWEQFVDTLDAEEADWLASNFGNVKNFIRRRPDGGLVTRRGGFFPMRDFSPCMQQLAEAGLLMYPDDPRTDDLSKTFSLAYAGPTEAWFVLTAYASGEVPFFNDRLARTAPPGLARVRADLKSRRLELADFHQAATMAAEMSRQMLADEWIAKFGPCRIYALEFISRKDGCDVVPVLLSPGMPDHRESHGGHDRRWRVSYERLEGEAMYRAHTSWFLTVEPA